MPKVTAARIALTALIVVGLTGCAGQVEEPAAEPRGLVQSVPSATPESAAESTPSVDITAPGEVCDPGNANDAICAAFYPEQAAINATSAPRALEPLASMSDEEKIALAHQACEILAAGGSKETSTLVETIVPEGDSRPDNWNAGLPFAAGRLGFCQDQLDEKPQQFIAHYRQLGEEASKAEFADGSMPQI